MVAPIADTHIKTLLDLSEMLVKLATQICQQMIVGGFEQKFPGFYCCAQGLVYSSLRIAKLPQSQASGDPVMN